LDQRLSTIPQHQRASKLLGFDFRVEYKSGVSNIAPDALSHRDIEQLAQLSTLFDQLRQEVTTDDSLCALGAEVTAGARGEF
jgi:hypothetical protein